MGLRTDEFTANAHIDAEEFSASVPIHFTLIYAEDLDATPYEMDCAMKAIAFHILRLETKKIRAQLESEADSDSGWEFN